MSYGPGSIVNEPVLSDSAITGVTGAVYRNGTLDSSVTVTCTGSGTSWRAAYTIPGTYSLGDQVQCSVTVTTSSGTSTYPLHATILLDATVSSRSTLAAGAAMTLTSAYDAAKTASQAGAKMDIVDAPNATAIAAIQNGLSTLTTSGVQSAMTSQGYTSTRAGYLDVLNGIVSSIWSAATRTLTAFGFTVATNSDTNVSAIKAKTDNLPSDPASDTNATANKNAIYNRLGAPTGASLSADIAAVKSDTGSIKTTTDLLATGWTVPAGVIVFKAATLANAPGGGGGGDTLVIEASTTFVRSK